MTSPPCPVADGDAGGAFSFSQAAAVFLDYMRGYRSCAPTSVASYARDLREFHGFLARTRGTVPPPADITRQQVMQFAVSLSHRAPLTIRRKLTVLASFFGYLQDMGYVGGNPARRLPLPKLARRVPMALTEEEAQRLLRAASQPCYRCLIVLLLLTGLRRAEAARISLDDVDLVHQQLLVHGKGARERMVPLAEQAVEAIREYLPHRVKTECRRLFVSRSGRPVEGRVIARMLQRSLRRAGLSGRGITTHRLRHTFATYLVRYGVDIRTVQELLGHTDIGTTAHYLHSDLRTKLAAVGKLETMLRDGSTEAGD